jgi:DNA-binding transcriptional regulator WhiA
MAEWRKVAKAFALGDGHISQKEVATLRQALLADGSISKSEMDFLLEIKQEAKTTVAALDELIQECEKLAGGK